MKIQNEISKVFALSIFIMESDDSSRRVLTGHKDHTSKQKTKYRFLNSASNGNSLTFFFNWENELTSDGALRVFCR